MKYKCPFCSHVTGRPDLWLYHLNSQHYWFWTDEIFGRGLRRQIPKAVEDCERVFLEEGYEGAIKLVQDAEAMKAISEIGT